jgi:hypothetical protein
MLTSPGINLGTYFNRCLATGYSIKLKHLGIYNLYAPHADVDRIIDPTYLTSVYSINVASEADSHTVFIDATWKTKGPPKNVPHNLKVIRSDVRILETDHALTLSKFSGLEEIYFVSNDRKAYSMVTTENGSHSPKADGGNDVRLSVKNSWNQAKPS